MKSPPGEAKSLLADDPDLQSWCHVVMRQKMHHTLSTLHNQAYDVIDAETVEMT